MKPTTIEFSFDDAKLEAINIFLGEKESSISDELDRFMDALYKKHVPQAVREFIDKKEAEEAKATPPQRQTRRRTSAERNDVSTEKAKGETTTQSNEETPV